MKKAATFLSLFIAPYRNLPKGIYVLFIARIINRMGDFVNLILVFYLTRELGYAESFAGLIITIGGVLVMVGGYLAGWAVDRMGRRTILTISMTGTALCFIPCGFMAPGITVPILLTLSGFFRGAGRPVQNALVADLTEPGNRQAAFSLLSLGINIGVSLGPMIAGFLYRNYLSWVFWGDGITILAALFLILKYVPDTTPSDEMIQSMREDSSAERSEEGSLTAVLLRRPVLLLYSLIALLNTFVYAQHAFAIPLHLKALFQEGGARYFGMIMSFNAVVVLLGTPVLIHLLRRKAPLINIGLASLLYALGFGMLFGVSTLPWFFVSTLLWTIGEIVSVTNHGVFVANHTPITHRGRFNGYMSVILGSGHALSPWLTGIFIQTLSINRLWPFVGILGLVSGLFYFLLYHSRLNRDWTKPKT